MSHLSLPRCQAAPVLLRFFIIFILALEPRIERCEILRRSSRGKFISQNVLIKLLIKSTPLQHRQLMVCHYDLKQQVDGFVGELTF